MKNEELHTQGSDCQFEVLLPVAILCVVVGWGFAFAITAATREAALSLGARALVLFAVPWIVLVIRWKHWETTESNLYSGRPCRSLLRRRLDQDPG